MRLICVCAVFASSSLLSIAVASPAQNSPGPPPSAEISADLGSCSALITVTGRDSKPVYAAKITTRIQYGMLGVKKLDLEAYTGSDGKVTIDKLPDALKKPMYIHVSKGDDEKTVEFKPSLRCHATFDVLLAP